MTPEEHARAVAEATAVLRELIRAIPKGEDRRWALKHLADAKCLALRVLRGRPQFA